MDRFQEDFAVKLASSEGDPLFFGSNLKLKDGRETPYFVNIGGFLQSAVGLWTIGHYFSSMTDKLMKERQLPVDMIAGPSYKASSIAVAAAMDLFNSHNENCGVVYDRKEVKAHGDASGKGTMFVGAKFYDGCNVLVVDDVGTSMRTKIDFIDKIRAEAEASSIDVRVSGVLIGVDREQVGPVYREGYDPAVHSGENSEWVIHGKRGEDAIARFTEETGVPVFSVLGVRELMQYYADKRLDVPFRLSDGKFERVTVTPEFLEEKFEPYMEKYGAKR